MNMSSLSKIGLITTRNKYSSIHTSAWYQRVHIGMEPFWSYMYIYWFTWIIIFDDPMFYTKEFGVAIIHQFYQLNGKLPLPHWEQDIYPVMTIYGSHQPPLTISRRYWHYRHMESRRNMSRRYRNPWTLCRKCQKLVRGRKS